MRACHPMLYGDIAYMRSETQSCFPRWAVFERSAIFKNFWQFCDK